MGVLAVCLIAAIAGCAPLLHSPLLERRLAAALVAVAFGTASAQVGLLRGGVDPGSVSAAVDGGLALAGLLGILLVAAKGWLGNGRIAPSGLVLLGGALAMHEHRLLAHAGAGGIGIAFVALGVGALLVRGFPARRPGAISEVRKLPRFSSWRMRVAVVALAAAMLAPSAWVVIVAALVAAAMLAPLAAVLAAAGLIPFVWFLHTVAGPVGLGLPALSAIPLSPAAESLAAPLLALGAWILFGLWPARRFGSPVLALVGAAVLLRLGAAVPSGLAEWGTVLVPLGVIGLVHAAITGDASEGSAAWAWLGAVTGAAVGAWLLAAASIPAAVQSAASGHDAGLCRRPVMTSAIWAAAAGGGALALASVLRVEVTYAVVAALVSALALVARRAEAA